MFTVDEGYLCKGKRTNIEEGILYSKTDEIHLGQAVVYLNIFDVPP